MPDGKWVLLENHINERCEELHELRKKAEKRSQFFEF